jgi:hypothetical protein
MIRLLAIFGIAVWFILNGLLWYARLPDVMWFWASMILGVVGFSGFFCYLMAGRRPT